MASARRIRRETKRMLIDLAHMWKEAADLHTPTLAHLLPYGANMPGVDFKERQ